MNTIEELFERLEGIASSPSFVDLAAAILDEAHDWAALVREWIDSRTDDEWRLAATGHFVPEIEPRAALLHLAKDESFAVVVNAFDKGYFDDQWRRGVNLPHRHRFSFATRILSGSYQHWLFREALATAPSPLPVATPLEIESAKRCRASASYALHHDKIHLVSAPEHGTVTLMIRGREVAPPSALTSAAFSPTELVERRSFISRSLARAPRTAKSSRTIESTL